MGDGGKKMTNQEDRMEGEAPRPTVYVGTPIELEAMLRKFFWFQRMYLENATDRKEVHELFERTAWRIEIVPLEGVARERVRDEFKPDVARIDAERELYDLLCQGQSQESGGEREQPPAN